MTEETTKRGRPRSSNSDGKNGDIVTPKTVTASGDNGPKIEGAPTPIVQRDTTGGVKAKYLSLKISEDGSFDLSKMRDKNKTELRDAFSKTARKGELGGNVDVPETFTSESMLGYVSLLFGLEAQIVVKMKVADPETAAKVFALDRNELISIATPAAKVANKYMADFKYADEMALVGAVTQMTFTKIMYCRALMEQRAAEAGPQAINSHARSSTQ